MRRMIELSWRGALLLVVLSATAALLLAFGAYQLRHADHLQVREPPALSVSRPTFPLALEPTGRYLVDHDGKPFLIQGEAAWSLVAQLRPAEVETYLEDRRRRGFNLLMVNLIEHFFSDQPPLDAFGVGPFRVPGDFSTPNPQYFERAQAIVRVARSKGQVVLLCPAYLGGDGSAEGWYQEMTRNGPVKLRGYGVYVGELFREFDNVIWLAGGDFTPPAASLELVDAVQQGIKQAAPAQLQTGHFSPETSALDVELANTRFDLNTTYTYHPAHLKSLADYQHGAGRPHFLIESKYEDDELGTTERWLRAQAYTALLTGAVGQVFGNRWIWTFTRPTLKNRLFSHHWLAALDSPGTRSMGFVRALFEKLPWTTLQPDERFEVLCSGQGSKGSIDYPVLASTRDGQLAIAYVPTARGVRIDVTRLKGPLRARWYDPTSGLFSDAAGMPIPQSPDRWFVPAAHNASGDSDWLLLLETAG
jgi:uncharacterized protein DUF4038/collagenase-like protein with putative collagen-binding domain